MALSLMTPAAAEPAVLDLDVAGVCRRFGQRWALVDISFELPRGRMLAVTGRNGSGKSTLLRILAAALRPDYGRARVAGYDPTTDREAVRRRVALLSHDSYLYEPLTALENLALIAHLLGKPADDAELLMLLDGFGLGDHARRPVAGFSAGMRRRLALARIVLHDAPVVLLDEPYTHLDPSGTELVDELIILLRCRGSTIVMATHRLDKARAMCDQALVLDGGRMAWRGLGAALPRDKPNRYEGSA
jgi:heme exporter protein A